MVQQTAPASKRRLNVVARELRRPQIFAALEKRIIDPAADHAQLQLMRLEPALRLAAGALAGGETSRAPSGARNEFNLDSRATP